MTITYDDQRLVIRADADDRRHLAELKAEYPALWDSERMLYDVFDSLIANSDLQWVNPADTGDLTSAPMLGIIGHEGERPAAYYGTTFDGSPILHRWAYMDYAVRNPLDDLLGKGEVVFVSGQ